MPKTATGPSKAQRMGDKNENIGSPESRARARLEAWRLEQLELCREGYQREDGIFIPGPLYWAQHYTRTFDDHWKEKGTDPNPRFPSVREMPYMPYLFHKLMTCRRLFIPKSREMMLTWAVMVYSVWSCQTFPQTSVVIQAQKEDKVADLIKGISTPGYVRTLYEQQDDWLKARHPLVAPIKEQSTLRIGWKNGSSIQGIPKGPDQIRQYHPTIYIADEAAPLDGFQGSYDAADPVCSQMIAVSSAAPSWFGDMCDEEVRVKEVS